MKQGLLFLIAFVTAFLVICVGGKVFGYDLDGVAVFIGSLVVGGVTASTFDK